MTLPLEGRTIALAEGRQLEELAAMLAQEGALPLRCPLLSILDNPDASPVETWLDELIADRFDLLILMTGEAVRRLAALSDRCGKREAFVAALGRVPLVKYFTFSVHPDFRVRLIENFDWLSPPYQYHHTKEELCGWFERAGFTVMKVLPHGLIPKPGVLGLKK